LAYFSASKFDDSSSPAGLSLYKSKPKEVWQYAALFYLKFLTEIYRFVKVGD